MKLLYVTTHLPPDAHFGGVVEAGQNFFSSFRSLLPDVAGCCVSSDPSAVTAENPLHPVCTKTFFFDRWGFSPGFSRKLRPMVSRAEIVAVNGILSYPMTVAGLMCRNMGRPYVVSLHGGLLPRASAMRAWRKKIFYRMFVRRILTGASVIHATSEAERDCIRILGIKTPITIVPNGTVIPPDDLGMHEDLPSDVLGLSADQRLVLFLGRIEPVKGLALLLEVWSDIQKDSTIKNVTLVIAGPDERGYVHKLKSMAKGLGIEGTVIFLGMVEGPAKWALYRRADFFILPSYSENFALVVAEALACGTPVITTTGTPWKDLELWKVGRCVAPERPALSGAVRDFLSMGRENLIAMGERGRSIVRDHYSWETVARKMLAVYRAVLENEEIPPYPEPIAL